MTTIVDTSFLVSLTNPNEYGHKACVAVAKTIRDTLIVPQTVLPEATYLLDKYLGHHVMREFVRRMLLPVWTIEPIRESDLVRTAVLLEKYHDNRLDFVDATLIAIAERLNIQRVLTLDKRHFRVIRPSHCPTFELLPS